MPLCNNKICCIFLEEVYNVHPFPLIRWSSRPEVRRPGPLPGWHQSLSDSDGGLPDAEAQSVHERRLRHRQDEKVQHLAQLQLHGPAPGLWAHAGPEEPMRQPHCSTEPAALLHHPNQSQCLPAGPPGVHVRSPVTTPVPAGGFIGLLLETLQKVSLFSVVCRGTGLLMLLIQLVWGDCCWTWFPEGQSCLAKMQLLFTEWGETVKETETETEKSHWKGADSFFNLISLLDSWGLFSLLISVSEETAVRYASKLLGWCAKDMIVQTGQIWKRNPFLMFVLGSSTRSPKTSRGVVSFVFCEDLPVWGWSTPALNGTPYTGLDFTFVESFQAFIHCVYILI